jgi:hypothetical protein
MKAGRIQAKDISDEQFRAALDATRTRWGVSMSWHMAEYLNLPWKVVLAKARGWEKRGLLDPDSCTCGCRGDWKPRDP